MKRNRTTFLVIFALVLFVAFACTKSETGKADSPDTNKSADAVKGEAAAVVNGSTIPMAQLETAVRNVVMQNGMGDSQSDAFLGQFGPRILEQLIDGELLWQEAERKGFIASDGEVETAYGELASRYPEETEFKTEMEARGFTEESLKSNIRKQISIQNYIKGSIVPEAEVPEEAVRAAYDENPQNFTRPEEVKASHILIKSSEADLQEQKASALAKANEIAVKARKPGTDFAELAKTSSEGPSAPQGGDLGFFTRGRMVKPFEDAAFSMKVGDVSDPVLTQFGYHIIKVTERKEGQSVGYEEVKDQLAGDLTNRMVNEMVGRRISELRESAKIELLFNPEPPQVPTMGGNPHAPAMK
ncbi:MAG: peptidylprolyl isomerase [bacterium]|nr:peptidylprolyl isomerase [bacterium]